MEFLGGGFEARAGAQKDTQCFAKSLVVIRVGCERTEHLGDPNARRAHVAAQQRGGRQAGIAGSRDPERVRARRDRNRMGFLRLLMRTPEALDARQRIT